MQEKEAKAKQKPTAKKEDPNDIFTDKDIQGGSNNEEVKFKRDVTPMPDYYKAWDRFNVDDALDSDEENKTTNKITYKEPEAPKSQADMMRPTSGAAPHTKIVIKGGTQALNADAEHLKS